MAGVAALEIVTLVTREFAATTLEIVSMTGFTS
jgi:hypothetical protein